MQPERSRSDNAGGNGAALAAGRIEAVIIEAACRIADLRRASCRFVLAEKGIVGDALFGVTERDAGPLFQSDRESLLSDWQLQIDTATCDISEESLRQGMDSYA